MTTPAVRDHQSPLEVALLDVHATLVELLVAADEQYAALVARDRDRLESVTRQQERLSTRLTRAESRRIELLGGAPLQGAMAALAADQATRARLLNESIATLVDQLKERQSRSASLLQRSIELAGQTLTFLQRLVTVPPAAYGSRGITNSRQSLLVDSRA